MIIIHIGLPKTASSKILNYINLYTDISTKFWMKENSKSEIPMKEALEFNYKSLSYDKNYFIKNPTFIVHKKLPELLKRIKNSGHQFKLIVGVRDIVNMSYSLYNHWYKRNELRGYKCALDVYNCVLAKFFSNIKKSIKFLKKYDTIIYNVDNYEGDWFTFFSELFKLLEIKVDIKKSLPNEKLMIPKYSDIDNLEENIKDITSIRKIYNNYFEGKTIFKI